MNQTANERERALLVAIDTGKYDVQQSLDELELLAQTIDIDTIGSMVQNRTSPNIATFIGKGKLEELAQYVENNDINLIIFDDELSASQIRNLEKQCDVAVIDRTMLILDIFAENATTSEGRLQVELAQHKYLLPRLAGMGISLSRLGGGGSGGGGARRGKGESKLELDRRHIRKHIDKLETQLKEMEKRRSLHRKRREKDNITTVAIVGYTNVGKSTLLNTLTDAGVLVENKLFATLDPTSRALVLPDGRSVMLIDTVGLVRRLPHHLVEAFKSTLEEAVFADLLLNICDISSEDAKEQIEVTEDILNDLGVDDTPIITILNKCDLVDIVPQMTANDTVLLSAKTGFGITTLLEKIVENLPETQTEMALIIPYNEGWLLEEIRKDGLVKSEEFKPDGTHINAMVNERIYYLVEKYKA